MRAEEPSVDPDVLWTPGPGEIEESRLSDFMREVATRRGRSFVDYGDLHRWSVDDLDGFWSMIWEYFGIRADGRPRPVLESRRMPGSRWFPNASLNYAEHVFEGKANDETAIIHRSEVRELATISWGELRDLVAACAAGLRKLGVERGDHVVAYMPNIPETVVAFLATASLGAIWSSCSPDFGAAAVLDRFAQIRPKALFVVDGYRYGGKDFDRAAAVAEIQAGLPGVKTVLVPYLDRSAWPTASATIAWPDLIETGAGAGLSFTRVPFDHPLWILFSSGTTGPPKAIVQGQGGILLEHLKALALHLDVRPGDRFFWFTTTGWMMWNFLVSGLLTGAAIVLFDGNPGHPDPGTLWDLAEAAEITTFGTSAAYLSACAKAGQRPRRGRGLHRLRAVGSTGSPLPPEGFDWVYEELGSETWLFSISGGTDVCTAFLGAVPIAPVWRGELQGPSLGVALESWDDDGNPLIEAVGELVVTEPMPSMPLRFLDDPEDRRYRESYFEMFPGVWRHGDWLKLTRRGTAVIYGRSDSTINRGGIRMGTAEIYRAVLSLDEILDAIVVDITKGDGTDWMGLFVVLRPGARIDADLSATIARRVREQCSPRHLPDEVLEIAEVPRTRSGKVLEVPVKRILMGMDPRLAARRDAIANPQALDYFVELSGKL